MVNDFTELVILRDDGRDGHAIWGTAVVAHQCVAAAGEGASTGVESVALDRMIFEHQLVIHAKPTIYDLEHCPGQLDSPFM